MNASSTGQVRLLFRMTFTASPSESHCVPNEAEEKTLEELPSLPFVARFLPANQI